MTMITLICCVLALSSSAFGRSSYGSYSSLPLTQTPSASVMRDSISQKPFLAQLSTQTQLPIQSSYGQQQVIPQQQQPIQTGYGAQPIQQRPQQILGEQSFVIPQTSYSSQQQKYQQPQQQQQQQPIVYARPSAQQQQQLADQQSQLQQIIQDAKVVTEADKLCVGQQAETIIPLDGGRRFVVCVDESKGFEQQCPKGLVFHPETRRCERKLGPLENPCVSQPCLNGGQCAQTEIGQYQCQCPAGFDGKNCELDARVCQTQQPCGQSSDSKCQSFRIGAALQYVCILRDGQGYGLNAQQVQQNPCQGVDGPRPLAISDKGFIMCDGESMFVESCPGGTVWDDLNKACVWPDMQGVVATLFDQTPKQVPQQSYGQQSYGQQSYGQQRPMTTQTSYGQVQQPISLPTQQVQIPQQQFQLPTQQFQLPTQQVELPQQQVQIPQQQFQLPTQQIQLPQQEQPTQQFQLPQKQFQLPQQKTQTWQQPIQRPVQQQQQQVSSY